MALIAVLFEDLDLNTPHARKIARTEQRFATNVTVALTRVDRKVQRAPYDYDAFRPSRCSAWCRSQSAWSRIQSCGDVFKSRDNRSAVSAVMPRLPRTISLSRLSEMPSRLAAWTCPKLSAFRYSSSAGNTLLAGYDIERNDVVMDAGSRHELGQSTW
jgi:hypothetical protein